MKAQTGKRLLRAALGLAGLGALGAILYLLKPPCPILQTTGFYCGACGVTRLVERLLAGDLAGAFRENQYMFLVLPLAALWLLGEAVCYVRGVRPLWRRRWMPWVFGAVLAAGLVFTVVRNLPGLSGLRPL
ncbi:MAG: DUF2752 domain-containing protein [Acutalibacter sp.]|jgi:hypothetical protein